MMVMLKSGKNLGDFTWNDAFLENSYMNADMCKFDWSQ